MVVLKNLNPTCENRSNPLDHSPRHLLSDITVFVVCDLGFSRFRASWWPQKASSGQNPWPHVAKTARLWQKLTMARKHLILGIHFFADCGVISPFPPSYSSLEFGLFYLLRYTVHRFCSGHLSQSGPTTFGQRGHKLSCWPTPWPLGGHKPPLLAMCSNIWPRNPRCNMGFGQYLFSARFCFVAIFANLANIRFRPNVVAIFAKIATDSKF